MSKYTTGEIAKLCGVTVRTVQYYDNRNILVPTELSEGGRRLYTEEDLKKMQIICFLRDMGFSIDNIGTLFSEENTDKVISVLIKQQEQILLKEIDDRQTKLNKLLNMKRSIKNIDSFSVQSLGDIAHIMKNQAKRKKMLTIMLAIGIVMDIIEVSTVVYGINTGVWWPLIVGIPVVVALGVFISYYYFSHSAYICPDCHEVFKPKIRESFFAAHTPNTRRLICPKCGKKSFCVECYTEAVKENEKTK